MTPRQVDQLSHVELTAFWRHMDEERRELERRQRRANRRAR